MIQIYLNELESCRDAPDAEKLSYFSSILRSLLQTLALSAFEVAYAMTPSSEDNIDLKSLLNRFAQPTDGLPIECLDVLIPVVRSHVSKTFMLGWFETTSKNEQPIVNELLKWVEFRNKRPGHGVTDRADTTAWANRLGKNIKMLLEVFAPAMPLTQTNGNLELSIGEHALQLSTPLVFAGKAIVVSKILARKGIWKVYGQLLSLDHAKEFTIDLGSRSIFLSHEASLDKFKLTDIPFIEQRTSVFNNIPVRQTTTFVGRTKELIKLEEWLNDMVDSRYCLVYGDGGFGKTTLALEFFNRLLDGELKTVESYPAIISFYTAKKTKWTDEGLVHFKGISDAMEDSVRELLYFFHSVLGKEWYRLQGTALIDKIVGEFVAQGFTRNDILLIIDNTETLATSAGDVEELANFITMVGRKLGRVVITSRRREFLPATPIPVGSLSLAEAVALMTKLGAEYAAESIIQAGEARLRKSCEQLMLKPLLIDTFVRYVARSSAGIQDGLDQILKKTSDELLEFLYEDAWLRMNPLVREVFLVLVTLASSLNGKCVGDVCQEIGVQHTEFQSSLDETYFASIIDHGETYDLEIVELAKKFFRQKKTRLLPAEIERFDGIAFRVDKQATARFETERDYKMDRVADAFRSQYAKAAKILTIKKDYQGAIENFNLALLEEPLNAALHERYASFLFRTLNKADEAKALAELATKLDPKSGDAWLTLGLIEYQFNNISAGDTAVLNAVRNGKPEALGLLRQAIARYHFVRRTPYGKNTTKYLKETVEMLERSMKLTDPKGFYYKKNVESIRKYDELVKGLRSQINRREFLSEDAAK